MTYAETMLDDLLALGVTEGGESEGETKNDGGPGISSDSPNGRSPLDNPFGLAQAEDDSSAPQSAHAALVAGATHSANTVSLPSVTSLPDGYLSFEATSLATVAFVTDDAPPSPKQDASSIAADPVSNGTADSTAAVSASGDQRIDGILAGVRWGDGDITYSDPDSTADYGGAYGAPAALTGFSQFNAQQMITVHFALNTATYTQPGGAYGFSVEGFTGLNITYAGTGTGVATMRFANSTDPSTAYAYYPSTANYGGDSFYGAAYDATIYSLKTPVAGGYAWHTIIHEIGHALGLKHGHDASGFGKVPDSTDSVEFTVMTYRTFVGDLGSGYDYEQWGAPQTFMMYDISALQYMYGADFTTNSGDTTYTWNPTTGAHYVNGTLAIAPGGNRVFMTIWDGGGNDTYDLSNYSTNLTIDLNPGAHSVFSSAQLAYLGGGPNGGFARGNVFNALLYQGNTASLIENAVGGSGNDSFTGNSAANTFTGNDGNDVFDGNGGSDTMYGGGGNDFFYLDDGDGIDDFNGGADTDSIYFYNLVGDYVVVDLLAGTWAWNGSSVGDAIEIENIYGTTGSDSITGNAGTNTFFGYEGNDYLNGGAGDDNMYGGLGDDVYEVAAAGDFVSEAAGEGTDTVRSWISWSLGNYLERLELMGGSNINGTGNSLDNTLAGNAGNNILNGGTGNDYMKGYGGDDTYVVSSAGDATVESAGGGIDTVYAWISWTLAANVERLILQGSALNGTGNSLNNTIAGTSGNNLIDGGGGNDYMAGYSGDDIYVVDAAGDAVAESAGGGTDTVRAWVSWLLGANLERLELQGNADLYGTGNSANNTLVGNSGNNVLNGGAGSDYMAGGAGDDIYIVSSGDAIAETVGNGIDTIRAAISWTLGANLERLELQGASNLYGTGNSLDNTLVGNSGNNVLNGGAGADYMAGGTGNDIYVVGHAGDVAAEAASNGIDTIRSWIDWTLGANLERLELQGGGNLSGTGNGLNNTLVGNGGNNVLSGGWGNDYIVAGAGADTLVFDTTLSATNNADTIVDFSTVDDSFHLENAIFTALGAPGVLAAAAFTIGAAATTATHRIIYDSATGALSYDSDGTGGTGAIRFANLSAGLGLSNSDFIVV